MAVGTVMVCMHARACMWHAVVALCRFWQKTCIASHAKSLMWSFAMQSSTCHAAMLLSLHVGVKYNETYVYHRNGGSHTKGDLRAAIAPFKAHALLHQAHLTTGAPMYKWMLYGDDDTIFNHRVRDCRHLG